VEDEGSFEKAGIAGKKGVTALGGGKNTGHGEAIRRGRILIS